MVTGGTDVATLWFDKQQRDIATIATIAANLGGGQYCLHRRLPRADAEIVERRQRPGMTPTAMMRDAEIAGVHEK